MTRILTGMQASGTPHLGNYLGMMRRTLELQKDEKNECLYFIADMHSFTSERPKEAFQASQMDVAKDWIALGLDTKKAIFYRQSDVADLHAEAMWMMLCNTPMGLLQRAHSYKDKVAKGLDANAGLFTYPVLMAMDILLYHAHKVPVGKDQAQHLEITRDIAQKWNSKFGDTFTLPEVMLDEATQVIPGTDGQKMSKSYGNTIPLFGTPKELKKAVMGIQTATTPMGEPIDGSACTVLALHKVTNSPHVDFITKAYAEGSIGFGESKKRLLEHLTETFAEAQKRRNELTDEAVLATLADGAKRARTIAEVTLADMREALGLSRSRLS